MHGGLHLRGYNIMLEQLIAIKHHMAKAYADMSHKLSGDKRDLILRLAQEERESALMLINEFKTLFCCEPESTSPDGQDDITLNYLVRLEADCAVHFFHASKNAPNRQLSTLYKTLAEKAANHGYLLLLIIQPKSSLQ